MVSRMANNTFNGDSPTFRLLKHQSNHIMNDDNPPSADFITIYLVHFTNSLEPRVKARFALLPARAIQEGAGMVVIEGRATAA